MDAGTRSFGFLGCVGEILESAPLTNRELKVGSAVRVVSCVRSNDRDVEAKPDGFVWSVFLFERRPSGVVPQLEAAYAAASLLFGKKAKASCCAETAVDIDGTSWYVSEFELYIPRRLLSFTVRCGSARCSLPRLERNHMVERHFAHIRNAYAAVEDYAPWLERHRASMAQELQAPSTGPRISLVTPVYRTPPDFLEAMLSSVEAQTYVCWELVLVNASPDDEGVASVLAAHPDPRIVVVDHPQNDGIAGNTNVGIAAATGDYVAFLDHDDFLEPYALAAIARAVNDDPAVDLLYCDEDTYDGERFKIPLFKPPLNWDFLHSNNYVIHLLTVSRRALEATERSGPEVDGAQDYDLTLKVLEQGRKAVRLPYVLYHWRQHAASTNANAGAKPWAQEAGRRAIADHLERRGIAARVTRAKTDSTYRVDFSLPEKAPALACIVLGEKLAPGLADGLREYGLQHSVPSEVLCVAPTGAALVDALRSVEADAVLVVRQDACLSKDGLERMLGYLARPEVFSVSPRVMRRDGLVESSGCLAAPDGSVIKLGKGLPWADEAFLGRAVRPYDHLVVSDDTCLVRTPLLATWLEEAATYDHPLYALNALAARAHEEGLLNVYSPFAEARLEGPRSLVVDWAEPMAEDAGRFLQNHAALLTEGDPTHNPNFDPWSAYYKLSPFMR